MKLRMGWKFTTTNGYERVILDGDNSHIAKAWRGVIGSSVEFKYARIRVMR